MSDALQAAQDQWNETPCGTGDFLVGLEEGSLEYFDAIRDSRYGESNSWLNDFFDWESTNNQRVLEIGHGVGSDLVRLAQNGALVSGIDATEKHHQMAKKNLQIHGLSGDLRLGDATQLPFEDSSFDQIYTVGVLHHMEHPETCMDEILRVLKPGGKCTVALYYKYSAFHLFAKLLNDGLYDGNLFSLGYRGLLATIESGADGRDIKPFVRTYSKREMRHLLANFSDVCLSVRHFSRDHMQLPFIGHLVPESLEGALEKWLGWYVVAEAVK